MHAFLTFTIIAGDLIAWELPYIYRENTWIFLFSKSQCRLYHTIIILGVLNMQTSGQREQKCYEKDKSSRNGRPDGKLSKSSLFHHSSFMNSAFMGEGQPFNLKTTSGYVDKRKCYNVPSYNVNTTYMSIFRRKKCGTGEPE